MQISRNMIGTVVVGGALTLTVSALAYPSMLGLDAVSTSGDRLIANTQWGPFTESDRAFVVAVRAAGLWEHPVGLIGLQKGQSKEVRTASQHLVDGHAALDETCRKIAPLLNVTLPNIASPQQEGFVTTLKNGSGQTVRRRLRQHPAYDTRIDLQHRGEGPLDDEEHAGAHAGRPGQRHRPGPHHRDGEDGPGRLRHHAVHPDHPAEAAQVRHDSTGPARRSAAGRSPPPPNATSTPADLARP